MQQNTSPIKIPPEFMYLGTVFTAFIDIALGETAFEALRNIKYWDEVTAKIEETTGKKIDEIINEILSKETAKERAAIMTEYLILPIVPENMRAEVRVKFAKFLEDLKDMRSGRMIASRLFMALTNMDEATADFAAAMFVPQIERLIALRRRRTGERSVAEAVEE